MISLVFMLGPFDLNHRMNKTVVSPLPRFIGGHVAQS
jgi:hypothetical protein